MGYVALRGAELHFRRGSETTSWDPTLFQAVGQVIGQEARPVGRTMIFAPAFNIERDPLGGRFFEFLTEDPYLNSQLAPPNGPRYLEQTGRFLYPATRC